MIDKTHYETLLMVGIPLSEVLAFAAAVEDVRGIRGIPPANDREFTSALTVRSPRGVVAMPTHIYVRDVA